MTTAKDVIKDIQEALKQAKDQGSSTVSINALKNYLSLFDKDVDTDLHYQTRDHEISLAKFIAENDRNIAHTNNQMSANLASFKAGVIASQSALKSSMIINGGAAIALLAFMGKIWDASISKSIATSLSNSMLLFCLGILFTAIATGTTFSSQLFFSDEDPKKLGAIFQGISITLIIVCYLFFAAGSYEAYSFLETHWKQ
ncbi:MAG: hypothetical protein JKY45_00430 [Emcibacter sp.]|nr:hypothetical protein [Emcibacter sp.]